MAEQPSITYRVLTPTETKAFIHPFLPAVQPDPEFCKIVVAEVEGKMVGFQVAMAVVHLEPIWVDPAYRGSGVAARLFKTAASLLDHFRTSVAFVFADRSKIAEYLERLGLTKLPYSTYLYDPNNLYPKE